MTVDPFVPPFLFVVSAAGTTFRMGVADMRRLITDLGYQPRQRDNWYRLLN